MSGALLYNGRLNLKNHGARPIARYSYLIKDLLPFC